MPDLFGYGRRQIGDPMGRYVLRERWRDGPLLGCMGMNPSHACEEATDMTWLRWRFHAEQWGFGGQIVVNPVPFRSPEPKVAIAALKVARDSGWSDESQSLLANLDHIAGVAAEADIWLLGWGDMGQVMDAVVPVLKPAADALRRGGATRFMAFGVTKAGAPMHMLARGKTRIAADAPVFDFDPGTGALGAPVPMPWKDARACSAA